MSLPMDVGHAGLRLSAFLIVLAGLVLWLGRPSPDSAAFVVTVVILAFSALTVVVLLIMLRYSQRRNAMLFLNEEESER